jgi:fibrillarin-like rRNA methylase
MDINTARRVLEGVLRSSEELQKLLPILKERCSPEEYDAYLKGIAAVIAEAGLELTNRITEEHPELDAELDARVEEERRRLKP